MNQDYILEVTAEGGLGERLMTVNSGFGLHATLRIQKVVEDYFDRTFRAEKTRKCRPGSVHYISAELQPANNLQTARPSDPFHSFR